MQAARDSSRDRAIPEINKTIGEVDWDGKTVWEWGGDKAPGGAADQHHDWRRLPNGNTLILANLLHPVPGFFQPQVLDDVIYEIEPGGAIVWKWIASEHLDEFGFAPNELNLIRNAKTADYLHVNNMSVLGANHWFSAGDKRFDPDNVLIDSRNANVTVIVDKKTGKIVWRWDRIIPPMTSCLGVRNRCRGRSIRSPASMMRILFPRNCPVQAISSSSTIRAKLGIRLCP